jgi:DNA repair protein RadC
MIIKEMNNSLRPYEKTKERGVSSLSDEELMAVILRNGTRGEGAVELAQDLLRKASRWGNLIGLSHMTYEDLIQIRGIGKVKALQIIALVEFAKRFSTQTRKDKVIFDKPESVAAYYMESVRHLETEQVKLIMLDNKCSLISDLDISKGTVNSSIISTREIFIEALRRKAVYIMLLHNHPSGDPTPSRKDFEITDLVKDASLLVNIPLLDHIVIGDNKYYSFREHEKG